MSGPLYEADPPDFRLTAPAEDMLLVYHRPSGITHVLASPAPELLDALAGGPADALTLAARLGVGKEQEAEAIIAARLAELEEAGLVRAVV